MELVEGAIRLSAHKDTVIEIPGTDGTIALYKVKNEENKGIFVYERLKVVDEEGNDISTQYGLLPDFIESRFLWEGDSLQLRDANNEPLGMVIEHEQDGVQPRASIPRISSLQQ